MKDECSVALIGDYDPTVIAHRAIPAALDQAAAETGIGVKRIWVHTSDLSADVARDLGAFSGIWCVPASPYANTAGALAAIRVARETGRPFLGTCGGFQHALLEYAQAVWGLSTPSHAEIDPDVSDPIIAQLDCPLVEATGTVVFAPGSRLAAIYGSEQATETYHCRYGLNRCYAARLDDGPLRVSARDESG